MYRKYISELLQRIYKIVVPMLYQGKKKSRIKCGSALVPYGLKLSNMLDDFQSLRNLMNSRNWKSVI